MFEFLLALSGGIGVIAAALAVCFGYRADVYNTLGYTEDAFKYYKIMWLCLGYILLWIIIVFFAPIIFSYFGINI